MKKLILILFVLVSSVVGAQSIPNVVFPTTEPSVDTYAVNISGYGPSYNDKNFFVAFRTPNSGVATLNVTPVGGSALGAKQLRKFNGTNWVPIGSGDILGDTVKWDCHYHTASGTIRIAKLGAGAGGGGVTSVTGTTNRITSTGGTTPTIDISATFEALVGKRAERIDQNNAATTSAQLATTLSDEVGTTGGFARASYVDDVRKWPTVNKTASFQAALVDAGTNCYHITSGAATITFPSMTGLDGQQWGFYVEPGASAVFDFEAVTANGARHLPDSSIVYVRYSSTGPKFIVAGTNPATGGGGSGTVETVVAGNLIDVDATDAANPIVAVETGDKGDVTIGSNTLVIDNNAVTFAKMQAITDNTLLGANGGTAVEQISISSPMTLSGNALGIQIANTSQSGSLSSTDWNAFNGKQNSITFGTGVLTALGVNIGSAGAPILFNGAAGTPSSITLTNGTGLPAAAVVVTPSGNISATNAGTALNELDTEKEPYLQTYNTQTGSYTLVLTDADKKAILMNVASGNNLTVPPNSSVAFPVGTIITYYQLGAGLTTVVQGSGVTVHGSSGVLATPGLYIKCTLEKIATDEWVCGNGLPSSTVVSGTYTPTLTNSANVAASTAYTCGYQRIGNNVTVFGRIDIDPTTTLTDTQLGISLPISSALTTANQAGGTAAAIAIAGQVAAILSDATNDRALLEYSAVDVTNQAMYFIFSYQVL